MHKHPRKKHFFQTCYSTVCIKYHYTQGTYEKFPSEISEILTLDACASPKGQRAGFQRVGVSAQYKLCFNNPPIVANVSLLPLRGLLPLAQREIAVCRLLQSRNAPRV